MDLMALKYRCFFAEVISLFPYKRGALVLKIKMVIGF